MSGDMPDLVRQLRSYSDRSCHAAADEIERLRVEVERLEAELAFANDCLTKASGYLAGDT